MTSKAANVLSVLEAEHSWNKHIKQDQVSDVVQEASKHLSDTIENLRWLVTWYENIDNPPAPKADIVKLHNALTRTYKSLEKIRLKKKK